MEKYNSCKKAFSLYAKSGVIKKFISCGTCQCTPGVEDSESKIQEVSSNLLNQYLIFDDKDTWKSFQGHS